MERWSGLYLRPEINVFIFIRVVKAINITSFASYYTGKVCFCGCNSLYKIMILPYISSTIWWRNVIPGILVPCDPMIDLKIFLSHCNLYLMVQYLALYFKEYLMEKYHTWDIGSMWPDNWPQIYLGDCDLYFMVQ